MHKHCEQTCINAQKSSACIFFFHFNSSWFSPRLIKEQFGYLSILSFWRKWALGEPTNRIPLDWEKSSKGKWLKTAFEKNAHVPVARAEMLVTKYVLSNSRHLVKPFNLHTFLRLTGGFLSIAGGQRKEGVVRRRFGVVGTSRSVLMSVFYVSCEAYLAWLRSMKARRAQKKKGNNWKSTMENRSNLGNDSEFGNIA